MKTQKISKLDALEWCAREINQYQDNYYLTIEIKKWKASRTLSQNNFEHLLYDRIVEKIAYETHENPNYIKDVLNMSYMPNAEEIKEVIKADGGPWIKVKNISAPKPSSQLSIDESTHRIEHAFIMATRDWQLDMGDVIEEWQQIRVEKMRDRLKQNTVV